MVNREISPGPGGLSACWTFVCFYVDAKTGVTDVSLSDQEIPPPPSTSASILIPFLSKPFP
jgi:hypothetical protein